MSFQWGAIARYHHSTDGTFVLTNNVNISLVSSICALFNCVWTKDQEVPFVELLLQLYMQPFVGVLLTSVWIYIEMYAPEVLYLLTCWFAILFVSKWTHKMNILNMLLAISFRMWRQTYSRGIGLLFHSYLLCRWFHDL